MMYWGATPDLERLCFSLAIVEGDEAAKYSVQDWLMEQGCDQNQVGEYLAFIGKHIADKYMIEHLRREIRSLERLR